MIDDDDSKVIVIFRLEKMGALEWKKVVQGNEKWRLVTSMWLHAGIFHLVSNMFNVILFGIRLEQQFGFSKSFTPLTDLSRNLLIFLVHLCIQKCLVKTILAVKFGLIYLISGFGGNILSALFLRNSISVGASGALLGILGAMLSELLINWTIYANKVLYILCSFFFLNKKSKH